MAMKRTDSVTVQKSKFLHENSYVTPEGFEIKQGDLIKIKGEYGVKFKFWSFTTNSETGAVWIDCFETYRGTAGSFRSFRPDRLKRIPQRGKRAKRVV